MRLSTIVWCGVALALANSFAPAAEDDIAALRAMLADQQKLLSEQNARIAAQDARMSDLQAKMVESRHGTNESAAGVVSVRKNATVTVGGLMNTKYLYSDGKVKSDKMDGAGMKKRSDLKAGNLYIHDAKLWFKIDVNDHFDAWLQMEFQHDQARYSTTSGVAQKYWVRWKNLCNSGFSILVGRNDFLFSDRKYVGEFTGLLGRHDEFSHLLPNRGLELTGPGGGAGEGMFSHRNDVITPNHVGWDYSRTTQINPHWESQDGKLRLDLTLMQSAERMTGSVGSVDGYDRDGVYRARSINYGLGSGTFRVTWKPIEGLSITGSVANFYQGNAHGGSTNRWDARRGTSGWASAAENGGVAHPEWVSRNATATHLAIWYNPACASNWNFWGKWTHGWNDGWTKDLDSDAINFGASYTWADRLTYFAQADLFWNKNGRDVVETWYKGNIWAIYTGIRYDLPYGASLEAGWRHEELTYKNRAGYKHTKATIDTIYGHVGLGF